MPDIGSGRTAGILFIHRISCQGRKRGSRDKSHLVHSLSGSGNNEFNVEPGHQSRPRRGLASPRLAGVLAATDSIRPSGIARLCVAARDDCVAARRSPGPAQFRQPGFRTAGPGDKRLPRLYQLLAGAGLADHPSGQCYPGLRRLRSGGGTRGFPRSDPRVVADTARQRLRRHGQCTRRQPDRGAQRRRRLAHLPERVPDQWRTRHLALQPSRSRQQYRARHRRNESRQFQHCRHGRYDQ